MEGLLAAQSGLWQLKQMGPRGDCLADDFSESVNRSADGMIRIHGPRAMVEAHAIEMRMVSKKDSVGERMWKAIVIAIKKKQQAKEP
jgi:hypothetical protein